jgi:hypothetical protein
MYEYQKKTRLAMPFHYRTLHTRAQIAHSLARCQNARSHQQSHKHSFIIETREIAVISKEPPRELQQGKKRKDKG